jgi:hypothetical protein
VLIQFYQPSLQGLASIFRNHYEKNARKFSRQSVHFSFYPAAFMGHYDFCDLLNDARLIFS